MEKKQQNIFVGNNIYIILSWTEHKSQIKS